MDLKTWKTCLLMLVLTGCCQTTIGKVPLVDGKLPPFFKVGETRLGEVLDRYGQPPGYREESNRSVMIYDYSKTTAAFFPFEWGSYRIFLVFENNVLKKTEVQKLSWKTELVWKPE